LLNTAAVANYGKQRKNKAEPRTIRHNWQNCRRTNCYCMPHMRAIHETICRLSDQEKPHRNDRPKSNRVQGSALPAGGPSAGFKPVTNMIDCGAQRLM
jgi:hypothetical protein